MVGLELVISRDETENRRKAVPCCCISDHSMGQTCLRLPKGLRSSLEHRPCAPLLQAALTGPQQTVYVHGQSMTVLGLKCLLAMQRGMGRCHHTRSSYAQRTRLEDDDGTQGMVY